MNFEIFDALECGCGQREFRLRDGVMASTTVRKQVTQVLCTKFCGYRNRPVISGHVTPADCQECRTQTILQGAIQCSCGRGWRIQDGSPQFSLPTSSKPDESGLRVVRVDHHSDPRWRPFVAAHPEGTIFHHPGWMRILEDEYHRQSIVLACEDENGKLAALLPLVYTRGFPLVGEQRTKRRISSLPRTPVSGPLSINPGASLRLLRAAVDLVNRDRHLQLEIKTQTAEFDGLVDGLARVTWNPSFVLKLPAKEEELQLGDSRSRRHHIRGAVNRALRSGVQVRPAETEQELRDWYELYLDSMRRRVVPARPFRLFAAMWEILRPRGQMELLLAEKSEAGTCGLLAGSIFLKFGRTVFYSFTGCRREDFSLHPHDLIQWHAIHGAVRDGFLRYDFGEVPEEAPLLANFKSKWGAKESSLCRYYYPVPDKLELRGLPVHPWSKRLVSSAWQKLPLPLTARLGDWIYSFL
jgi:hypothetical protein